MGHRRPLRRTEECSGLRPSPPGHRRVGVGRNFYEIQILAGCHGEGFLDGVDPVLALRVYDPYLRGADIFVDARSSSFSDGGASWLVRHRAKENCPEYFSGIVYLA